MEMHSDEDNAEEWEWEWNVGELENGLEKREREMQSDEDWFLKGRMGMECVNAGEEIGRG